MVGSSSRQNEKLYYAYCFLRLLFGFMRLLLDFRNLKLRLATTKDSHVVHDPTIGIAPTWSVEVVLMKDSGRMTCLGYLLLLANIHDRLIALAFLVVLKALTKVRTSTLLNNIISGRPFISIA